MFCLELWAICPSVHLSVCPSHSRALQKTTTATVVLMGSFESLIHIVLGKLKLVTIGYPKSLNFWGKWGVVPIKPAWPIALAKESL